MRAGAIAACTLVVGLLPGPVSAADAEQRAETREVMRGIFAAFSTLVSRSQDPARFSAPAQRAEIAAALAALAERTHDLDAHPGSLNPAHRSVQRSLADDVKMARQAYAEGFFEAARFRVQQMAEDCFACHSKLPSGQPFDLGAQLIDSPAAREMPAERRALLAVAARQFETALGLYEALFRDPTHSATEIALSGAFESYLKVALRVSGARDRALAALGAFLERSDVPRYLQDELGVWVETLREAPPADASLPPAERLARARQWIREGQLRTSYPGDGRGVVHFMLASQLLNLQLDRDDGAPRELAEVFYLLGLCEIQISPSLWVSEVEDFLESAIRAAPDTTYARQAYTTLEAVYTRGFTGSDGTYIPPDVELRLATLRALVDAGEGREAGAAR